MSLMRGECFVLQSTEYLHHHVGTEKSECFYFQAMGLARVARKYGTRFVGRAARIEVSDTEDALHQHAGATIVFITSGEGFFKMKGGPHKVGEGDIIYVPPMTPHLSIAKKGTRMIELVVYLGDIEDMQISLPVPEGGVTNRLHLAVLAKGFTRATFFEALKKEGGACPLKHYRVYAWLDESLPKRPSRCYQSTIAAVLEIPLSEIKKIID